MWLDMPAATGQTSTALLRKTRRISEVVQAGPSISVVIATYDRYPFLVEAIESLVAQDIDRTLLELIVVDNSGDRSRADEFSRRFASVPNLRYFAEPIVGLSNARNIGVREARAPIVAFMDDDAVAAPDWCTRLVEAFDQIGERVAAVGGTILPRWTRPRPEWLTNSQLRELSLLDWGGETRQTWTRNCVFGCNLAFRKSVLQEVGGFHTELGRHGTLLISNDEIDAMERIEARGYLVFYCPAAVVHHTIHPERLKRSWFRRRAAWQAVSDFILHEDRAMPHGSAAARRVRDLVGEWLASSTKAALPIKREARLAYDLVAAALSGAEFLREPKRPKSPGRVGRKKGLRSKTSRAGARRQRK